MKIALSFLIATLLGLAGCGAKGVRASNPMDGLPRTVAVLGFSSYRIPGGGGDTAEDGCTSVLLERGVRVVERQRLDAIMQEKSLSRGGEVGNAFLQQLGMMAGADAVIIGAVNSTGRGKDQTSARLISTRSGEVLALARLRGRADKAYRIGEKVCAELIALVGG